MQKCVQTNFAQTDHPEAILCRALISIKRQEYLLIIKLCLAEGWQAGMCHTTSAAEH